MEEQIWRAGSKNKNAARINPFERIAAAKKKEIAAKIRKKQERKTRPTVLFIVEPKLEESNDGGGFVCAKERSKKPRKEKNANELSV